MTLAKLLASITKSPPRTGAQLRDDLAKIDMPSLDAKVAEIESERRGLLLRGTDADLEKNAKALAAAKLEAERGQAAIEEIARLIVEAETREGAAAIETQAADALQAVDQLAEKYSAIDDKTAELQGLFAEAAPLAAKISAWNKRAHQLGRPHVAFTGLDVVKARTSGAIR